MVVFDSWERVARERRIVSFIAMRDVELVRFSVGEGKALAECDLTNCRLAEQPTSARIPGPESQACHGRYLLNPPCGSLTQDGSTPSPPGLISCFPCEKSQNILTRHTRSSGGRGRVSSFSPLSRTTHTRPDATRPARHRYSMHTDPDHECFHAGALSSVCSWRVWPCCSFFVRFGGDSTAAILGPRTVARVY